MNTPQKYTLAVKNFINGSLIKELGQRLWQVDLCFYWWVDYKNKIRKVTIPKGFKTDLGSIPRILWFLFDYSKYISYILHDYLYETQVLFNEETKKTEKLTRKQCDQILFEAMKVETLTVNEIFETDSFFIRCQKRLNRIFGCIERHIVYIGVRLGGWKGWKQTQKQKTNNTK